MPIYSFMKLFLRTLLPLLVFLSLRCSAQLIVNNTLSPQQLVQTILMGQGTTASNITYTGDSTAIGWFDGYFSNIGLVGGILLCTGNISSAPGPNNSGNEGTQNLTPGDTLLSQLSGFATHDAAVLEFDLQPQGDTIRLRFVFASEEYNEYACGTVNDVFGFFISGPGIVGEQNIALIPGTNIPVSINTLNNGSIGSSVGSPDPNCILSYSGYFVDNDNPPGTTVQYDGFTTVLTAMAVVSPCQTYHLKFAIADGGDDVYDSGVFLETESFTSNNYVNSVASLPSGSTGCAPFTTVFQNNSTGSNSFRWNFGDGSPVDSSANPSHTFVNPGTYAVQLIAMDTGSCGSPDTAYINVYADSGLVSASFNSVQFGQCDSIHFDNSSSSRGAHLFSWNYGDGTTGSGIFSSHTYVNPGNYTMAHIATDTVCHTTDTAFRDVTLLPRIHAAIQASSDEGCEPLDLTMCYPDSIRTGMHLYWDFANGEFSGLVCDSVHYSSAGNYRARLIVTDSLSCNFADTAWFDVNVKITPEAEFEVADKVNIIYPVLFENTSVNGSLFEWSFGDGDSSSQVYPIHTYLDTGYYKVCLTAFRDECLDTTCHDVAIFQVPKNIWFPAAFTPNGDGRNDFFAVEAMGVASLKVRILNRWGELVFESTDGNATWDGTWKGTPAIIGVYAIAVEAVFLDGEESKKYGSITLYR